MTCGPQSFPVTQAWRGMRLDRFIQAMLPRMSRSSVQEAIARRVQLLSGARPKASRRVVAGEVVTIAPRERVGPVPPAPAVLLAGDSWQVIDKPAGLASTPHARRPGEDATTLAGMAAAHRLDRFTSGCLLMVSTREAATWFATGFRDGRLRKEYAAVVRGIPSPAEWTVELPLGPDAGSRVPGRMAVRRRGDAAGRPASTAFAVVGVDREADVALVRALPLTGRRHQVRVHLAASGHPVIGDLLYGGDERSFIRFQLGRVVTPTPGIVAGRHLLHARSLELEPPGRALARAVAPWPADFPPALVATW